MRRHRRFGFTLVELLVVIGIIAVLISILLPALQSARRSANSVKCQAALKEIGNAFRMYSIDYKGYYPPAQWSAASFTYRIDDTALSAVYWPSFLRKYVTKSIQGTASANADQAVQARKSVFWGCPAFDGYATGAIGEMNRVQTGYGMNPWPVNDSGMTGTLPQDDPAKSSKVMFWVRPSVFAVSSLGTWYKAGKYTHPAERALVTDSRFWMVESQAAPTTNFPPEQPSFNVSQTYSPGASGQTMVDVFRHGKYPTLKDQYTFKRDGGKVSFNILYADGHVANSVLQEEAYKSTRMRFPN